MSTGEVIFRHAEPVMGTVVSFDLRPQGLPADRTRDALADACAVLHRADRTFSLYRDDTPMALLRRGEITVADCPREVSEVLGLCEQARLQSGGRFDPWRLPGGLDPTGLVKGWAAREAARALADHGVGAGMVNAAGDIAVFGSPAGQDAWRLGIRSPFHPDQLLCVIDTDESVATSGSYERGEHIWDPEAGAPARGTVSASVCGPDLAIADALATGLLTGGAEALARIEAAGYEALIVEQDGRECHTARFPFASDRVTGTAENRDPNAQRVVSTRPR